MATTTADSITATLDRLARFESELPVTSLYLDARPDPRGRDHYQPFVRKELAARQRTYPPRSPERLSFDRDVAKIQAYLDTEVAPQTRGIAIFTCSSEDGEGLFVPLQLDVALDGNHLSVADRPQLFPLLRALDENPRYALVLTDTHRARIFVFAFGSRLDEKELESEFLPRTSGSGWSQMRYQRHVDEHQKHHAKEVVERLARIVDEERVDRIVLAGNDVILPLIRQELPKRLQERLVDTLPFDSKKPVATILAAAEELLREHGARTDAERVERLIGDYRAGGLGVVGLEDTRRALEQGAADELLIAAAFDRGGAEAEKAAGEFVSLAGQTSTRVTVIQDASLLEPVGGVGALLRYRIADNGEDASPSRPSAPPPS